MILLELTNDEAQATANLINAALKSIGMPAAQMALHLTGKLQAAYDASVKPVEVVPAPPEQ